MERKGKATGVSQQHQRQKKRSEEKGMPKETPSSVGQ
jgi:hypothetical protein